MATRDVQALTNGLVRPGVHLAVGDAPSRSHFGGDPALPPDVAWPSWNGTRLSFLARVSLAELDRVHRVDWLPRDGALLFFYDAEEQPWGFDPKDRGSSVVLHVPDLVEPVDETTGEGSPAHRAMELRRVDTRPSFDRDAIRELGFSEGESDAYAVLRDAPFADAPQHQIVGWPSPIQGDEMELESQLASNGLYVGAPGGYETPEALALSAGAGDWRLLLQFDSDDDLDVMWGDMGRLYFWIREADARAGRWDRTWLVLQCS